MSYRHGTYVAYAKHHCRCDKCREQQRSRVARNRKDRKKSGRLNHGTRSAYDCGCRCASCLAIRAEIYERESKGERRSA